VRPFRRGEALSASNGGRHGRCQECHGDVRRRFYARAAERIARREIAAGRDPSGHRGHLHYSRDPDDVRLDAKRRRAERLRVATREPYDRLDVFDRDRWRCWLCGTDVDRDSATVDHVIAIADGGADTLANVRTACGPCNTRRGARPPEALA
jgi:hypothetical protein